MVPWQLVFNIRKQEESWNYYFLFLALKLQKMGTETIENRVQL